MVGPDGRRRASHAAPAALSFLKERVVAQWRVALERALRHFDKGTGVLAAISNSVRAAPEGAPALFPFLQRANRDAQELSEPRLR